ncbi:MAG: MBL fold metallo-hydrolase [Tissierellia bacterium]|nr:MBL fold metallo-hydrolase [Tissierellia bacterium]
MLKQINIKYIYHSCYQVSIDDKILIFDYFHGDLDDLDPYKKDITFFASHSHPDHYNKDILSLKGNENIRYILSNDIQDLSKVDNIIYLGDTEEKVEDRKLMYSKNIEYMKPYDLKEYPDMTVRTFGSTDKGVSFLVSVNSINIFHAGDLNLWIWDEDTEEEREQMRKDFLKELDRIKHYDIDIAFFPLDPRLKKLYSEGFKEFIDRVQPTLIFPMHFRDNISYNLSFMNEFPEYKGIYRPVFKKNQIFLVNYEI